LRCEARNMYITYIYFHFSSANIFEISPSFLQVGLNPKPPCSAAPVNMAWIISIISRTTPVKYQIIEVGPAMAGPTGPVPPALVIQITKVGPGMSDETAKSWDRDGAEQMSDGSSFHAWVGTKDQKCPFADCSKNSASSSIKHCIWQTAATTRVGQPPLPLIGGLEGLGSVVSSPAWSRAESSR